MTVRMRIRDLIAAASQISCVPQSMICGPCRLRWLSRIRQAIYLLAHESLGLSYSEIGRALGNRDHSTVTHGVSVARERRDSNTIYRIYVTRLFERAEEIAAENAQEAERVRERTAPAAPVDDPDY